MALRSPTVPRSRSLGPVSCKRQPEADRAAPSRNVFSTPNVGGDVVTARPGTRRDL